MAQDVAKGRPTEIDFMNGLVVARGREKGIATPVSAAVVEVVHEVERGSRKPAPENIGHAMKRAGL
jgi:2-dehydropantoate 2-reductase